MNIKSTSLGELDRGSVREAVQEATHSFNAEAKEYSEKEICAELHNMYNRVKRFNISFQKALDEYRLSDTVIGQKLQYADSFQGKPDLQTPTEKFKASELVKNEEFYSLLDLVKESHRILSECRSELTNQRIKTKFIVKLPGGRVVTMAESALKPASTYTVYGGLTASNPFSAAYEINRNDVEKLIESDARTPDISDTPIWKKLMSYASKAGRSNLSKEAEMYELLRQNIRDNYLKLQDFSYEDYLRLYPSVGGGGGYATPYFKGGDVGLTQVKYVDLSQGSARTVGYARFSIARDRMRKLQEILSPGESLSQVRKNLKALFAESEKEQDFIIDKTTDIIMGEARKNIDQLLDHVSLKKLT